MNYSLARALLAVEVIVNPLSMNKIFLSTIFILLILHQSCKQKNSSPSKELIDEINLKRGQVISCGPLNNQFGSAAFLTTCSQKVKEDFDLAVKLLHSFEYDEAEKVFASVIDKEPACAMAYWGIAMSNFHPLWTPPAEAELKKGTKAIEIAQSLKTSKREAAYIDALAFFYKDGQITDHRTRCLNFEKGMEKVYNDYPGDNEALIFYALALNAAADPNDKTFSKQKKAGGILNTLYPGQPNHPGIVHYLIHTYDYPELASFGLEAARKYAAVAPSSAHALHMPSHIFTRLGLWDECIQSNKASVTSAQCYAQAAGIKGHWDEELHGLDYLVYAYLQKGENDSAKKQWDYLKTVKEVHPANFKVAYSYAAIPSRYLLENRMWKEAAKLELTPNPIAWKNFPWQEAIVHFTRLIGAVHTNDLTSAKEELKTLNRMQDTLISQKDIYKANQVAIQIKTAEAWIRMKEGKYHEALTLMQLAAHMEDKTEKHPVTPGEVIPARELLGDMLMYMNKPLEALEAYEADLQKHPNRFNTLYGAGLAAQKTGNLQKAKFYFQQLQQVAGNTNSNRPELTLIKQFLKS
jgi:tetratricopeptide (TPR) repeat protein